MERLFLIDGSALAYRAYYAFINRPLINSKGRNTSAIYGFTRMLLKLLKEERPDYLAVVFDAKGPTFRHKEFEEYKATRERMPDEMHEQIPLLKEVISAFNIPIIELEGYEADDVMGTVAKKAQGENIKTILVSGDKDVLQLLEPKIEVMTTHRGLSETEVLNREKVKERFGIEPAQIVDFLGLAGDAIDNIPGIPGIGEKTASRLIQEYGNMENIYKSINKIPGKLKERLLKYRKEALLSRKLATLDTEVPLQMDFDQLKVKQYNQTKLLRLFKELEFKSLIQEMALSLEVEEVTDYKIITTEEEFKNLLVNLKNRGRFAIDLLTTQAGPMLAEILGISFSFEPRRAFYLPFSLKGFPSFLSQELILRELKPVLEDNKLKKYGHDLKYIKVAFKNLGIELSGLDFDIMVASYLLDPSKPSHSFEDITLEYLGLLPPLPDLSSLSRSKIEEATNFTSRRVDLINRLVEILEAELKEKELLSLFRQVEIPLVDVLAEMEFQGVTIDLEHLKRLSRLLEEKIDNLAGEIYKMAGVEFNINSPQQLRHILFEKLMLPTKKRTKTGYSTDMDVLEELALIHPLPAKILEYRQLVKFKSTYIDALPQLINPKTGRVHTSFNQAVTATGRLSSSNPNLQNIPIRSDLGREIRKAFIPSEARSFILRADYSQIELRILAHISNDPYLKDAFHKDEDIHTKTAVEVFGVKPNEVTSEMRRLAKVVNFGIIYGISAFRLSCDLGVSQEEAQGYIDSYFAKYEGVKDYIDKTIAQARKQGYVTTFLGRRRYLPDINSSNRNAREFAERTAINTPIQGTAADLIKMAMVDIFKELKSRELKSKMLLQVHDELIFEVPQEELEEVKSLVKEKMEGVMSLEVPIKVEVKVGKNWRETG